MPDVVIVAVILLALALALWEQQRDPGRGMARARAEMPIVCAWCAWRDGETCTGPGKPGLW